MTLTNIHDELAYETKDDKVKFNINNISTDWMSLDDYFISRISNDNLNKAFPTRHLIKEIEIRNVLDEGLCYFGQDKFKRAIDKFDTVLYYDSDYDWALISKSHALYSQGHFVKSLRHYKRAVKVNNDLEDNDYYRLLLKNSNEERGKFPKLKLNIYNGDEFFKKGEFEKAVESYDNALVNPSKFKDKILSKLLNKKAHVLVKLNEFDEAFDCFTKSGFVFGQGYCQYKLNLKVNDEFKSLLNIDKKYQLKQAIILTELGFYMESLNICDYLLDNHFKCDDFYFTLLETKISDLKGLGEDFSDVEKIMDLNF